MEKESLLGDSRWPIVGPIFHLDVILDVLAYISYICEWIRLFKCKPGGSRNLCKGAVLPFRNPGGGEGGGSPSKCAIFLI